VELNFVCYGQAEHKNVVMAKLNKKCGSGRAEQRKPVGYPNINYHGRAEQKKWQWLRQTKSIPACKLNNMGFIFFFLWESLRFLEVPDKMIICGMSTSPPEGVGHGKNMENYMFCLTLPTF
jgi:hypothetical protein